MRTQLQVATDAASHAGASALDGTEEGLVDARLYAANVAYLNEVNGESVVLAATDGDITFGVYDRESGQFQESSDAEEIDAVLVELSRDDIAPFFSGVSFGVSALEAASRSITVRPPPEGASATDCALPLAVPSCTFDDYGEDEWNTLEFTLGSAVSDNVGWSHPDSADADSVRDQLSNCNASDELEVTDTVELTNGQLSSALGELARSVTTSSTAWDEDIWGPLPAQDGQSSISAGSYGNTFEGPIMVFQADDCSNLNFNQEAEIAGFAWGAIYDVITSGGAQGFRMRLETTDIYDFGTAGGGEINAGVTYQAPPMIVQ